MNAREQAEGAAVLARACAGCGHSYAGHLTVDMVIGTEGDGNG